MMLYNMLYSFVFNIAAYITIELWKINALVAITSMPNRGVEYLPI